MQLKKKKKTAVVLLTAKALSFLITVITLETSAPYTIYSTAIETLSTLSCLKYATNDPIPVLATYPHD